MKKKFPEVLKTVYRKAKRFMLLNIYGPEHYARYMGASIGKNCFIYTKHFGTEPFLIEIGDNVTIALDVKLINHDGSGQVLGRMYSYRKIIIGNSVFIGMSSIVLPGVRIGDNVIVGAGSVITKSIPSNSVVAGNPAKYLMSYEQFLERSLDRFPKHSDQAEGDYKARIHSILDKSMRAEMKVSKESSYF